MKFIKFSDLTNPPQIMDGVLDCSKMYLTSLEGIPEHVTTLNCSWNLLTSLEGIPEHVTTLICSGNQLTSLEGIPEHVTALDCSSNPLTSLEGIPKHITALDCSRNQLTSLEGVPECVTTLYCYCNQLSVLDFIPTCIRHICCSNNSFDYEMKSEIPPSNVESLLDLALYKVDQPFYHPDLSDLYHQRTICQRCRKPAKTYKKVGRFEGFPTLQRLCRTCHLKN